MSEYQFFLSERDKIDVLFQQGYNIKKITEDLNGATLVFEHSKHNKRETLQIGTAEGRKYYSVLLLSGLNQA
ncbi:hypothetical protein [Litchfieldia alkalitelluris]|uniref:hypothetical protein n=1 Tax=Litchfieldia alkalitelluris TaxID=304268 RepID=UPI000995E084|nr:hypothetical protein [Litchfieldia alkalitelluris]